MAVPGLRAAVLWTLWIAAAGAPAARAEADPYLKLSNELVRFAGRARLRRVAVLPFVPVNGGDPEVGMALAERLVVRLAREEGLDLVERTLLARVIEEQGLEQKGLVDPREAKKLGRVLGVEAVVTGTYLRLDGDRLEVNARLIHAETARILGVSSAKVLSDWKRSWVASGDWAAPPSPPDLDALPRSSADMREIAGASFMLASFRDALGDGEPGCRGWEARLNEAQDSVREIKARYWATRLRTQGYTPAQLTRNPGSEIRSLAGRQEFYRRIRELYYAGYGAGVSAEESARIEAADRNAEQLAERCDR